MTKRWRILLSTAFLCVIPSCAFAKVEVFACEPEWAALSEEIGGDLIDAISATTARQDVHHIRAKPSLLAAMRRADLVLCSGASLEIGWLPILVKKAGGPNVQPGAVGWLMASEHVERLGGVEHADRSMGDVHPEGNPHIQLDPRNLLAVAGVLSERLAAIDPANAQTYKANLESFQTRWKGLVQGWESDAQGLRGQKVVVYHESWAYLCNWLGMKTVASLEPKPGIPPTASHLQKILDTVRGQDVRAILVAPYENEDAANWLSRETGIPVVRMPFTVGGSKKANSLQGLFEESLQLLETAR